MADISRAEDQPGIEKSHMQGGEDDGEGDRDADRIEGVEESSDRQDRREAQMHAREGQPFEASNDVAALRIQCCQWNSMDAATTGDAANGGIALHLPPPETLCDHKLMIRS